MSAANPSNSVIGLVETRLGALRSQLARWFWVDGLMRVGWTAIGLIALDLGIDYFFRFDFAQRLIMLVLMVGVLVYVARRWLFLPLNAEINDDALCLAVEEQNPQVKQSLISALQFSRLEGIENRGMSIAMVKQTIAQGLQWAENLNFGDILDRRAWVRNIALLVIAVVVLLGAGTAIAAKTPLLLWFQRNILLGEQEWPQKTHLVILGADGKPAKGKVVFPRGGEWTQIVLVEERSTLVPDNVLLEFRRGGRAPQPMKKTADRKFESHFANVLEPFSFRARGGDDITEWVRVDLVEPPSLDELALGVTLPAYAGGKVEELPAGRGPYQVLKGSTLTIEATSNKPLKAAKLLIDGKEHPLQIAEGKGHSIVTGDIPDAPPGQYVIDLEDELGLHPLEAITFGIRPRVDREPRVKGKFVGVASMGMISVKARLPVSIRVTDDFGLTKAMTEFKLRAEEEARNKEGELPFGVLEDKPLGKEVVIEDVLEVEPLGLVPGDALTLIFAAVDNDNVPDDEKDLGPHTGRSAEFQLRIVSEEELRAEMLRREKEQRQEFERLVKTQEEILTDTKALTAEAQSVAELNPDQRNQLMQIQRRQKLIGTGTNSIAERLDLVVLEALNNRIEDEGGEMERRLRQNVITPMLVIVNEEVPVIGKILDESRENTAKQQPRQENLAASVVAQEKLLAHMKEVLSFLIQAEGFQEAINLILEISRAQDGVIKLTDEEKKKLLQRILEQKGQKPTPENKDPAGEKPENKDTPSGDKEKPKE